MEKTKWQEKETYTAGELAKLAGVSARTIRFYDKKSLLQPAAYSENGYRLYNKYSVEQLQKIRMLQYIGFSLDEIKEKMESGQDEKWTEILQKQKRMLEEKRQQIDRMILLIQDAMDEYRSDEQIHIDRLTDILQLISTEKAFDHGYFFYQSNTTKSEEWFRWTFDELNLAENARILDVGCGHGNIWTKNWNSIPAGSTITLVDKRKTCIEFLQEFYIGNKQYLQENVTFEFIVADVEKDWKIEKCYDRVVANHLWKFISQKESLMKKIKAVLCPGGFMLSTYSAYGLLEAIQEVLIQLAVPMDLTELIRRKESDRFLLEDKMKHCFPKVICETFSNRIEGLDHPEALVTYIRNCDEGLLNIVELMECEQKLKTEWKDYSIWKAEIRNPLYKCYADR